MEKTKHVFFAEKQDNPNEPYTHFFEGKLQVIMCGASKSDIVQVEIEETGETENTLWGHKDLKTGKISYIYPSKMQVEMCSPDSFKQGIKDGKCKFVRLKLTELPMQ